MRTISTFKVNAPTTTMSSLAPTTTVTASSTTAQPQPSPWHSPVPYLFGGLTAMLGLIAFALLMLACSYWRLSGQLQNEEGSDRDLESGSGQKEGDPAKMESIKVYEEKILVIMAGDEKPTFMATPVCAKSSSFGDGIGNDSDKHVGNGENCDKSEKEMDNHVVVQATTTTQENEGTQETQQEQQQSQ